jgi:hypothetical protein
MYYFATRTFGLCYIVFAELTGNCGHVYTDAAYLCLEYWGAEQKWNLHYRRLGS